MTKERALVMALRIVEVCQEYGSDYRCPQCPFNIGGCIVANGNDIPEEWHASEVLTSAVKGYKEVNTESDKGVLEKINEKQDSLKATCKAWDEAISRDGYVD